MALGSQIPDKTLMRSVTQKLAQRCGGSGSKINVDVMSGTVTLTGALAQEYQRKAILSSMHTITGVKRVVDKMTVAPPKKREDK
jgi:osmotically-inducible protein OsmY